MEEKDELKKEESNSEKIENSTVDNEDNYEEIDSIIVDNTIDEGDKENLDLRDIELKLQEIEIKIDEFEFQYVDIEKLPEDKINEYLQLKEEYKKLIKEKTQIKKSQKKQLGENNIEQSSMWIFLYGIVIDIITFPLLSYIIYLNFGSWLISKMSGLSDVALEGFFPNLLVWIIVFILPLTLLVLSWMIFANVLKKKIDKKIFAIFGILQALFTLISIIWISIALFA